MGRQLRNTTEKRVKRIHSILKRAPKKGIWMDELAKEVGVSRSHLNYYLFGSKKDGKDFGGYFRDGVEIIRREGNNKYLRIKRKIP